MEAMGNSSISSRSVLACAVDARWVNASSQQIDGPVSPSQAAVTAVALHQRRFKPIHGYAMNPTEVSSHGFLAANDSSWRPIAADLDWLEALTPAVSSLSSALNLSAPASTLANIFMSTDHISIEKIDNTTQYAQHTAFDFFETIISIVVADGISRVGYARQLESATFYAEGARPRPNVRAGPPSSANFTKMNIEGDLSDSRALFIFAQCFTSNSLSFCSHLTDNEANPVIYLYIVYAFRAAATTDYLSIAVLALYVLIALSHAAYTAIRGRSSRAWEKLEDFVVLMLNSRQAPDRLANTCAGVERARTKGLPSRIRVVKSGGTSMQKQNAEEEVQLVFVDEQHDWTITGKVEPDTKYGKTDGR